MTEDGLRPEGRQVTELLAARVGMLSALCAIALCVLLVQSAGPVDEFPVPLWTIGAVYVCGLALSMAGGTIGWAHPSGKVAFVCAWILLFPIGWFVALMVVSFFMPKMPPDF
jgi:hypothetical protein